MNSESQKQDRLRITEIFYSIQGESSSVGVPTAFVRLTGCPLRCTYCDTEYAFQGGQWMSFAEIIKQVESFETSYVTVTGGEPLAQKSCITLLDQLCDAGFIVSLETSGALSLSEVGKDVIKVMDIKTPGSAENSRNLWSNIELLDSKDQIKFVICSEQDYQWSKQIIKKYDLTQRCEILMSPSYGDLELKDLATWILSDKISVRLQTQLHKLIWGNEKGR